MPYFTYRQNNSYGRFTKPAILVVVIAVDTEEADEKAEKAGLYFDGAGDCPCCGDRWWPAYYGERDKSEIIAEIRDLKEYYPNGQDGVPVVAVIV